MILDIVLIVSSVAVIFLSVAAMELVFQRRLVEILDRFLSRNVTDLAAASFIQGHKELEQPLDLETELDLNALREARESLATPIREKESEAV